MIFGRFFSQKVPVQVHIKFLTSQNASGALPADSHGSCYCPVKRIDPWLVWGTGYNGSVSSPLLTAHISYRTAQLIWLVLERAGQGSMAQSEHLFKVNPAFSRMSSMLEPACKLVQVKQSKSCLQESMRLLSARDMMVVCNTANSSGWGYDCARGTDHEP